MKTRKAANVLPVPVGADTSVWLPEAIAGQAASCTAVGVPIERANHRAVCWLKMPRESIPVLSPDTATCHLAMPYYQTLVRWGKPQSYRFRSQTRLPERTVFAADRYSEHNNELSL